MSGLHRRGVYTLPRWCERSKKNAQRTTNSYRDFSILRHAVFPSPRSPMFRAEICVKQDVYMLRTIKQIRMLRFSSTNTLVKPPKGSLYSLLRTALSLSLC
jgi:hypothetical protein